MNLFNLVQTCNSQMYLLWGPLINVALFILEEANIPFHRLCYTMHSVLLSSEGPSWMCVWQLGLQNLSEGGPQEFESRDMFYINVSVFIYQGFFGGGRYLSLMAFPRNS